MPEHIIRVEKALESVAEMFRDRGFSECCISKSAIEEYAKESVTYNKPVLVHITDDALCILYISDKFSRQDFSKLISEQGEELSGKDIVLVKTSRMLPSSLQQLQSTLQTEGNALEVFDLKELQYNPSRHVLNPRMRKMDEVEIAAMLYTYQAKKSMLPTILKGDVMARHLGLCTGDVVEIIRQSPSAGIYVTYRHCV